MKRSTILSILILVSMVLVILPAPLAAQGPDPAAPPKVPSAARPAVAPLAPQPEWGGAWQYGPATGFQFTRFDGGYYPLDGMVYFMGGRLADASTDGSVWSFDPVAGTYADMGVDLVTPISNYKMHLLQDEAGAWAFYVLCGRPAPGGVIASVQAYYPGTNTAVQLDPADDYPGAVSCTSGVQVVYDNKVWAAGGFDGTANHAETWVFDPTAAMGSKWSQVASANLSVARAYIMGAVVDDLIYAIGGNWYDASGTACGQALCDEPIVEVLDPNAATPVWDDGAAADLPQGCSSARAYGFDSDSPYVDPDGTPFAGKIVSACGIWPDETNQVFVYDTGLDFWEAFPSLNDDRRDDAGEFVPPMGGQRDNGMPGMWVWGGRQDSDANVLVTSEYYDVEMAGACNILLVDDDWDQYAEQPYNGTGTYYYTSTLEALGYTYDRWDVWTQGDPGLGDLQPYDAVVWFTGYAWNGTVTDTNEIDLAAYLDGGGNLFLTAEDYLYEMGLTAFGSTYLAISDYTDDPSETDPVGNAGDPVGDGLGPYALTVPTSWPDPTEPMYTDYANANPGASEPFSFVASGENNSTDLSSGSWKTVFTAWPFEGLDNLNDRMDIMGAVIDWFCFAGPPPELDLIPPIQAASGAPGTTVPYNLTLYNGLGFEETFDLTYDGVWPITGPATVGPVPNGGTEDFVVEVTVPADSYCYEIDLGTITAQAQSAPVYTDTAFVETTSGPAGAGDLVGYVTDANTTLPVSNAEVIVGDYEHYTWTDVDGYYSFPGIDACLFQNLSFLAPGYEAAEVTDVQVLPGAVTTESVVLNAPMLDTDAGLGTVQFPDQVVNVIFDIANPGTADLNFVITELPEGPLAAQPPVGTPADRIDPQILEEIAASPEGETLFMVYMREQADLSAAYDIEDWLARGQYVYGALKATAERSQAEVRAYLDAQGLSYRPFLSANALAVEAGVNTVQALAAMPGVTSLRANYKHYVQPDSSANNDLASVFAPTQGITPTWSVSLTQAYRVWTELGITGTGVIVANIDSGVYYTHEGLEPSYRGNLGGGTFDHDYNWYHPTSPVGCDGSTEPCDNDSHGSATMGLMVGWNQEPDAGDPAWNAFGMAPGAQWIACKGCEFNSCSEEALLGCADWMLAPTRLDGTDPDPAMRPHVINNSWGGGQADWWYWPSVAAWRAAGMFPAFAAGNSGPACGTVHSPGDYEISFASCATDLNDVPAGYSSRGPANLTGLLKPNVCAPGPGTCTSYNGDEFYTCSFGGTSAASPHTAGLAALIWAAEPDLIGKIGATEWIIEQTADPYTSNQGCGGDTPTDIPNNEFGWGRINAYNAVNYAVSHAWDIPWLEITPMEGTVGAGDTLQIDAAFDSTGLTIDECYTSTLTIEVNTPYELERAVEVELCVVAPEPPIHYVYLPLVMKNH